MRTTLFSGCCAVSVAPPVCVWNRSIPERGSLAPNRSVTILDHIRLAARNFATSSKKFMWQAKKNDRRGANRSMSSPASSAAFTYAMALASVKAISWAAVEPASRMWYPEMEIVFHRGIRSPQYANRSVTKRMDGLGG